MTKRIPLACVSTLLVTAATVVSFPTAPEIPSAGGVALPAAFGPVQPRIAPDGEHVAFSYQGAIWQVPRDGGTMRRLTSAGPFDIEPAWSPDGKRIAYIHSRSFFGGELRIMDAADGKSVPLPKAVTAQGKLYFHPDGKRLLGNFQVSGAPESLAWLDLATGSLQSVLTPPRAARRFTLSHSGDSIAFVTTLDVAGQQTGNDGMQNDLWRVAARGGEPDRIVLFPARIHDACWTSGDQSIVITTDVGGAHYDLWEVPLTDPERRARRISFGAADEDRPSISRDGRWLVYTDNRHGATMLIARDLASATEQPVAVRQMDFARPVGSLEIKTHDKSSGEPIVARVVIEDESGKYHAPPGALYRIERTAMHFYCRDTTRLELPAGRYRIRAYRGPEYRAARAEVTIDNGKNHLAALDLERWEDFSSHNYYSGENHIHANYGYGEWYNTPETMLDQCAGEDLNVCNFMVANSDTDGVFDREFFRGRPAVQSTPRHILYWNQEFRSTIWGHMTLVNLRQVVEPVFTGFQGTTNPWDVPTNADIADRTHLQNGLVNYTHPAQNVDDPYLGPYTAKGLPIDAALGKIDSMDVMGSNHRATVPLWYRLLNCGFRIPASAGTDCFLNRIRSRLPGSDRAYVRIDGAFTYEAWIAGLRAGRSFVSNGPIVELTVDGAKRPGDTIELAGPGPVRVTMQARSQYPLEKIELVRNGQVIGSAKAAAGGLEPVTELTVDMDRTGWLAVRASGPGHPDHPAGELYAHTSPVYVTVRGRPADAAADARYFLAWTDRLATAVFGRDRIPSAELRTHVEGQFSAARNVYRKLAAATE